FSSSSIGENEGDTEWWQGQYDFRKLAVNRLSQYLRERKRIRRKFWPQIRVCNRDPFRSVSGAGREGKHARTSVVAGAPAPLAGYLSCRALSRDHRGRHRSLQSDQPRDQQPNPDADRRRWYRRAGQSW